MRFLAGFEKRAGWVANQVNTFKAIKASPLHQLKRKVGFGLLATGAAAYGASKVLAPPAKIGGQDVR